MRAYRCPANMPEIARRAAPEVTVARAQPDTSGNSVKVRCVVKVSCLRSEDFL